MLFLLGELWKSLPRVGPTKLVRRFGWGTAYNSLKIGFKSPYRLLYTHPEGGVGVEIAVYPPFFVVAAGNSDLGF
jgi:hypothetical protein